MPSKSHPRNVRQANVLRFRRRAEDTYPGFKRANGYLPHECSIQHYPITLSETIDSFCAERGYDIDTPIYTLDGVMADWVAYYRTNSTRVCLPYKTSSIFADFMAGLRLSGGVA